MNLRHVQLALFVTLVTVISTGQKTTSAMPDQIVIARDTFWDFGPPFSYYDLIRITNTPAGLVVDQVLVTPPGQACLQPAIVEEKSVVLHKTMSELLEGRNPCAIPKKDLRHEIKRCKRCLVFSGVNLTMQASCGGQDRQLRMNILDRDIYDSRTRTPAETSWSMRVLSSLSESIGPGSEAKPIFPVSPSAPHAVPNTPLVNAIRIGQFDGLFGKDSGVSKIVHEAEFSPLLPPTVAIDSVTPSLPLSSDLPKYPPIARVARVEGLVHAKFDIASDGRVQNIAFVDEPRVKMLELGVSEAISKWNFPRTAWGKSGSVVVRFNLNCTTANP